MEKKRKISTEESKITPTKSKSKPWNVSKEDYDEIISRGEQLK